MKKIFNVITICAACLLLGSCTKDSFKSPDGIINGKIIDASTGQTLQSGPQDYNMYVLETSYTASTPIAYTYNIQPNGLYNNDKVFAGTYKMYPQNGPFVPLVYTSTTTGAIVDNGSKTVVVKSKQTTATDWTVTPFLKVDWVGDPVMNANGTVTVQCTFVRGTNDPVWTFNVTDVFFFVSSTPFVASADYDNLLSTDVLYTGTAGNALLGKTITITSKAALGLHQGYYLRVGARTADIVKKLYNYTTVKTVTIP
jgi:hypothetical protein